MKLSIKGTVIPPRGTAGANGAFIFDLDVELPERMAALVELAGAVLCGAKGRADAHVSARQRWQLALEKGGRKAP